MVGLAKGPEGGKGLTEADLIKRLELALDDDLILAEVGKKGLAFPVDAAAAARLKKAGTSDRLLAGLSPATDLPDLKPSPAVQAVLPKLASNDPAVRLAATDELGKLKDRTALPPLIKALDDKNPQVRTAAAVGLQALADRAAVPALVKRVGDDVWWQTDNYDASRDNSKAAAYQALKAIDPTKLAGAAADALKSKEEAARVWACLMLGQPEHFDNKAAVDALVAGLGDRSPWVRRTAAGSLGRLSDKSAVGPLCKALGDRDGTVRKAPAASIQKVAYKGDKTAVPALVKRITDDVWWQTDNWEAQRDDSKTAACQALKALDADRLIPALAEALKSKEEPVRAWAALSLSTSLGSDEADRAAAAVLVAALGDRSERVRKLAADGLGNLKGGDGLAALCKALEDRDTQVRSAAAAAIQKVADKGDKTAAAALAKRVGDDIWGENEYGAWYGLSKNAALAALKSLDADRMTEALTAALASRNDKVRSLGRGIPGDPGGRQGRRGGPAAGPRRQGRPGPGRRRRQPGQAGGEGPRAGPGQVRRGGRRRRGAKGGGVEGPGRAGPGAGGGGAGGGRPVRPGGSQEVGRGAAGGRQGQEVRDPGRSAWSVVVGEWTVRSSVGLPAPTCNPEP